MKYLNENVMFDEENSECEYVEERTEKQKILLVALLVTHVVQVSKCISKSLS